MPTIISRRPSESAISPDAAWSVTRHATFTKRPPARRRRQSHHLLSTFAPEPSSSFTCHAPPSEILMVFGRLIFCFSMTRRQNIPKAVPPYIYAAAAESVFHPRYESDADAPECADSPPHLHPSRRPLKMSPRPHADEPASERVCRAIERHAGVRETPAGSPERPSLSLTVLPACAL